MIKLELMDFCQCDCDNFEASIEHTIEEVQDVIPSFIPKRGINHNTIISCKHMTQCNKLINYLKKAIRDQNNPLNESRNKEV